MSKRLPGWTLALVLVLAALMGGQNLSGADAAATAPMTPVTPQEPQGPPKIVAPGHNAYLPLPENISTYGDKVDHLFVVILWVTGAAFVLTEGLLIYAMLMFRHRQGYKAQHTHGNYKLQILWTIVPGAILFGLAVYQIGPWQEINMADTAGDERDTVYIQVLGKQYAWHFRYPGPDRKFDTADDVYKTNELIIPKDRKVVVMMRSTDVIHSLFIPYFRFKQDVVPGMTVTGWFQATKTTQEGRQARNNPEFDYEIACAELCGLGHASMRAKLTIVAPEEFEARIAQDFKDPQEYGTPELWDRENNQPGALGWYSPAATGGTAALGSRAEHAR